MNFSNAKIIILISALLSSINLFAETKNQNVELSDSLNVLKSIQIQLSVQDKTNNDYNRKLINEIQQINITLNHILQQLIISNKKKDNTEQIKFSAQQHPMNQMLQKEVSSN